MSRPWRHLCLLVFFYLFSAIGYAQNNVRVSGTVSDNTGEPLAGVSITVKGSPSVGTATDANGKFSLSVPSGAVLVATYIGFVPQEIPIGSRTEFNILLLEDTQVLEEVVIVGFGTQKKVNLTGAVGVATAEDLQSRPVINATQALQGIVPGLNISVSGQNTLNSEMTLNVRGTTTIGQGSSGSPLVLIDGMEDNLSRINPQDIESISVLKDAAASAIYGSRAPFGVLLVTTKKGAAGRAQVNYNNNFRFSTPINMPTMADSWEFLNMFNDAEFANNGGKYRYFTTADPTTGILFSDLAKQYYDGMLAPNDHMRPANTSATAPWWHDYSFSNVDWLDLYYKNWTSSQEHNLSISGGTERSTYYLSTNYMDQNGLLKPGDDSLVRYAITGKFSAVLSKYVKIDYTSRFTRNEYERPTEFGNAEGFYDNVIRRARPVRPLLDPNGMTNNDVNYYDRLKNGGRNTNLRDIFVNQFRVVITPVKDWTITGELNARINNNWDKSSSLMGYSYAVDGVTPIRGALSPSKSSVYEYAYKAMFLNPNVYTNYSHTFLNVHNVSATAGFQSEHSDNRELSGRRYNLLSDNFPILDLTTTVELADIATNGEYQRWRTSGFFGRFNYDYNGKYLLEVNGRYDGSSRFRRGSRWVFSPSFSLGWNVAREDFFKPLTMYVNLLKPRFSYGQLANQNTNNWYPTYTTMNITGNYGQSWLIDGARHQVAAAPGLISSTLTWEKIRTTNLGIDYGALKNRLTGSFDYFIRKSLDMVGAGVTLPATLGTGVPNTNNLDLKTYGWELQISWRDRIKDFSYGATFNLSDSQTEILKYPNPTNRLDQYRTGEVTGNIYGYTTIGIARTNEEMQAHLANVNQSAMGSNWAAGDIMYADTNGDGRVNNGNNLRDDCGDLTVIGNSTSRYRVGLNLNMAYKGFDFQMLWQGVLKRDWDPGNQNVLIWGVNGGGEWWSAVFKEHLDYYRPEDTSSGLGPNVDARYPRANWSNKNRATQTAFIQNAAYLRLKNTQIGYTLPRKWTSKVSIDKFRIYASAENIATFTGLPDVMDPESVGIGRQGGITYPMSAVYSFGLSINF